MIKEENLKTEIWIYDHNWDDIPFRAAKYPQTILDDPKAVKFADGIAFHHYSALGWSSPKMMKKFRKKYPSIPFYFTEGSVFSLWGALRLARYLRYGSSSYNGWVSILDTEGNPNNGPFNPSQTLIQRQPKTNTCIKGFDYYMHVHFMRFIRAGARYLHAKRPRRWGFEIIAFQNKDSQKVVVAINRRRWKRNITIKLGKWSIRTRLRPRSINTILINKIINS